jgi:hypothetical protein
MARSRSGRYADDDPLPPLTTLDDFLPHLTWQPAGDALRAALLQLAAEGALPDAGSSADAAAQASSAFH